MNRPAALAATLAMAAALAGCAGAPQAGGGKSAAFARTPHRASPYLPMRVPDHADYYYGAYGGVDQLSVRLTASGNLIRLSYRVIDPAVAKVFADKNITPYLFGPRAGRCCRCPRWIPSGSCGRSGSWSRADPIGWCFPTRAT